MMERVLLMLGRGVEGLGGEALDKVWAGMLESGGEEGKCLCMGRLNLFSITSP